MAEKLSSVERWTRSVFRVYAVVLIVCWREASATDLYFSFITSNSGPFASGGSIPALDIALEQITANGSILPNYTLKYTLRDSQCNRIQSLDVFFQEVLSDPVKVALLGCGCSVATGPVAEISHQWNISHISYASSATGFADRDRFRNFFRTHPSDGNSVPAVRSLIEFYGWKRLLVMTQMENLFMEFYDSLVEELQTLNVNVSERRFSGSGESSDESDVLETDDLFGQEDDYRVFFLNMYSDQARKVICEAYSRNLLYPRYAFITYGWYQEGWWTAAFSGNDVNCSDSELATFLDRVLAVQNIPAAENDSTPTDTGLSAGQFTDLYTEAIDASVPESNFSFTPVAALTYDAVWALALALNRTEEMMDTLNETEILERTGCDDTTGALVPLSEFEYSNALMGCVIRWNIQKTNFIGVSGPVEFGADDGSRVQNTIRVLQYRFDDSNTIERQFFGISNLSTNPPSLSYLQGEGNETTFPEGIPPDGTPLNATVTYHLGLVVIYDILATLGIIFAVVCLAFNIIFRNRKVVQLTSPNLNYFIIAGTVISFVTVYIRLIPSVDKTVNHVRCNLSAWLSVLGYIIAYATILSKLLRVYHIFHNPTSQKKKAFKDVHLVGVIAIITGVGVFMLILGSVIPQLRPNLDLATSAETPQDRDIRAINLLAIALYGGRRLLLNFGIDTMELGVRIDNLYWQCYGGNDSAPFIWLALIYLYLAILQVVGIVLALQTRKVTIKALNDAKVIAALIYVSSILLVILAVVTFALGDYINVNEVLFTGGLLVAAIMFLVLIFVPKMYRLYRDPLGENIFSKNDHSTIEIGKSGSITVRGSGFGDNTRIKLLMKRVEELEKELQKHNISYECDENGTAQSEVAIENHHEARLSTGSDADETTASPRYSTVHQNGSVGWNVTIENQYEEVSAGNDTDENTSSARLSNSTLVRDTSPVTAV